jgi:hypothetical protein
LLPHRRRTSRVAKSRASREIAASTAWHYCLRLLAARSIIGANIRPLNLTGQADFRGQRSETGQAWRLVLTRTGLFRRPRRTLSWVPPNLLIAICRCQD